MNKPTSSSGAKILTNILNRVMFLVVFDRFSDMQLGLLRRGYKLPGALDSGLRDSLGNIYVSILSSKERL